MIEALVALSRQYGCYKVILDCSEENAAFYEKCGLSRKGVQMVSNGWLVDGRWSQIIYLFHSGELHQLHPLSPHPYVPDNSVALVMA